MTARPRIGSQRVEINSDNPDVVDVIKSTYIQKVSEDEFIRIMPQVEAEARSELANEKAETAEEENAADPISGQIPGSGLSGATAPVTSTPTNPAFRGSNINIVI